VHDKESLAIVESFKKWWHYLEGVTTPVEVFTDHKNLTYFSETKTLSQCLARWSEFLSQFNISIKFRPGRLGKKLDILTRRWDVYGDNPLKESLAQKPVFTQAQLTLSDVLLGNQSPSLWAATLINPHSLVLNIKEAQKLDYPQTKTQTNGE